MDYRNRSIIELSYKELANIHLKDGIGVTNVGGHLMRSTLSITRESIQHTLCFDYTKSLVPIMLTFAALEQVGTCYSRSDMDKPRFANPIKKCLYYFCDVSEEDEIINIVDALRNGLLHNVCLNSYTLNKKHYYRFQHDDTLPGLYKSAQKDWNGDYRKLDKGSAVYLTYINTGKISGLIDIACRCAISCNAQNSLVLNLEKGERQLYYDYFRSLPEGYESELDKLLNRSV